jgi:hypothetical protein
VGKKCDGQLPQAGHRDGPHDLCAQLGGPSSKDMEMLAAAIDYTEKLFNHTEKQHPVRVLVRLKKIMMGEFAVREKRGKCG